MSGGQVPSPHIKTAMSIRASRDVAAPPSRVFAAFEDRARLAAWWGPAGFTNTFEAYEFAAGGRWSFVMHGPDGKHHRNEIVVAEVERPGKIVLAHVSPPRYRLTVTLEPTDDGGTRVGWHQEFEDPDVGRRTAHVVVPANEQNLDRLAAEALRTPGG